MLKKISIVTTLSATLLLGGAFQADAASADAGQQSNYKEFKVTESFCNFSWEDIFNKLQINGNNSTVKQPGQVEQPEQEESQPVEQPNQEQSNQEQPNVEEKAPAPNQTPTENQEPTKNNQENQSSNQNAQLNQFEQEVVQLTNDERAKNGLSPLKADTELSKVAREKSSDMLSKNYFDHNSPTYGSPFDMMKSYGISYKTAGENIAKGQRSPQEVVKAWMDSPGHRENILNADFTHIGVGYVEQGNHWTQMFIGK